MNALIWVCHTPDFVKGPLHSTLVDFTTMFLAIAKRTTNIVQPVIPFSRLCQLDFS